MIIIIANPIFYPKFSIPSPTRTPIVTAGLKCPPVTSPKIHMLPKMVRPTANGYIPPYALVLIAYSKLAVPIISKSNTNFLFSAPPLTSIKIIVLFFINYN